MESAGNYFLKLMQYSVGSHWRRLCELDLKETVTIRQGESVLFEV